MPAPRLSVAFALPALALAACEADECDPGTAECENGTAAVCYAITDTELTSHGEWTREACGDRHCKRLVRDGFATAICALDPEPDESCPTTLRERSQAARCQDGKVVTWRYGYRTGAETCPTEGRCVDTTAPGFAETCDSEAFCSPQNAPDPLCGPGIAFACADSRTIVQCKCGYRADAHTCENPGPSCVMLEAAGGAKAQAGCR